MDESNILRFPARPGQLAAKDLARRRRQRAHLETVREAYRLAELLMRDDRTEQNESDRDNFRKVVDHLSTL